MKKLLDRMFSDDYGEISSRIIHFYVLNEGVCLFKYFVKIDDPQEISDWILLTMHFLCFFWLSVPVTTC